MTTPTAPTPTRRAVAAAAPHPAPPAAPASAVVPPRQAAAPLIQGARSFSLNPGPGNPWPLFSASLRNVIRARKTVFLFLFMLIPLAVTWIISANTHGFEDYEYVEDWGGAPAGSSNALLWFQDASLFLLFPFFVPIVIAVFAASVIGEEVEGKTLPYIFTRPVYRNWILFAKASGTFLGTYLVAAAALVVFWFGTVGITENPFRHIMQLFGFLWVLALGVLAAGSAFLLLGVLWRRSIILILIYVVVWESFLANAPAVFFKRLSIVNYERPIILAVTGRTEAIQDLQIGYLGAGAAHVILLLIALVSLAAAFYVVSNKDYNV